MVVRASPFGNLRPSVGRDNMPGIQDLWGFDMKQITTALLLAVLAVTITGCAALCFDGGGTGCGRPDPAYDPFQGIPPQSGK